MLVLAGLAAAVLVGLAVIPLRAPGSAAIGIPHRGAISVLTLLGARTLAAQTLPRLEPPLLARPPAWTKVLTWPLPSSLAPRAALRIVHAVVATRSKAALRGALARAIEAGPVRRGAVTGAAFHATFHTGAHALAALRELAAHWWAELTVLLPVHWSVKVGPEPLSLGATGKAWLTAKVLPAALASFAAPLVGAASLVVALMISMLPVVLVVLSVLLVLPVVPAPVVSVGPGLALPFWACGRTVSASAILRLGVG